MKKKLFDTVSFSVYKDYDHTCPASYCCYQTGEIHAPLVRSALRRLLTVKSLLLN